MSTDSKTPPDWAVIERDYRAGIKPLRQIGEEHGLSHAAVAKRAKKDGWPRDLKAAIQAKADEKVSKAAVTTEVSTETKVSEKQVIEVNSNIQAQIRLAHRKDIGRARKLFGNLLLELEITTDNQELYVQLGELLDTSGPDSNGTWRKDKMNEIYQKVISLSGRVDDAKKLSDMLERVVKLERQAFGIDGEQQASPLDEVLKRIAEEKRALKGTA